MKFLLLFILFSFNVLSAPYFPECSHFPYGSPNDLAPFGWKKTEVIKGLLGDTFEYYSDGMLVDLFEEIVKTENIKNTFNTSWENYNQAKTKFNNGDIPMLMYSYFYQDQSKATEIIFPGYLQNIITLVYITEKPFLKSQLKDIKVAIHTEEDFFDTIKRKLPENFTPIFTLSQEESYRKLLSKQVDAIMTSKYIAMAQIARFKLQNVLTISDEIIDTPYLYFNFSNKNFCSKYIPYIRQKLELAFNNPDYIKTLLLKNIDKYADIYKDEPSLMYEFIDRSSHTDTEHQ